MNFDRKNWKVVAISGVTNGGKTSLAKRLAAEFGPDNAVLMHQDEFYIPADDERHVWVNLSGNVRHQNWELIQTIDWNSFEKRIRNLILGTNDPHKSSNTLNPPAIAHEPEAKRFLILEGHVLLNHQPFRDLLDRRFFITLPEDVCRIRRSQRVYDPPDPPGYFDAFVWPMYLTNKQAMHQIYTDEEIIFLDGMMGLDQMYETILKEMLTL